eukprot:scaffold324639_cov54-Tisochrysis_lutea.AAC.1
MCQQKNGCKRPHRTNRAVRSTQYVQYEYAGQVLTRARTRAHAHTHTNQESRGLRSSFNHFKSVLLEPVTCESSLGYCAESEPNSIERVVIESRSDGLRRCRALSHYTHHYAPVGQDLLHLLLLADQVRTGQDELKQSRREAGKHLDVRLLRNGRKAIRVAAQVPEDYSWRCIWLTAHEAPRLLEAAAQPA